MDSISNKIFLISVTTTVVTFALSGGYSYGTVRYVPGQVGILTVQYGMYPA